MYSLKIQYAIGSKTYRDVKGHLSAKDLPGFLMIILKDESRVLVNMAKVRSITLDNGFFLMINEQVKKDSNGQADFADKIK